LRKGSLNAKRGVCFFAWEVLSLSAFLWHIVLPEPFRRKGTSLGLSFLILAALVIVLGLGLFKILKVYASFLSLKTQEPGPELLRSIVLTFAPLLLLSLIFLQCFFVLRDIRPLLLPVSLAGSGYLHLLFLARLKRAYPDQIFSGQRWDTSPVHRLSPKQTAWMLFGLALLIYAFLLSGLVVPAQPLTGDEPHYLLITKSLLQDGDVNLRNNYQNKDYLEFYPGPLNVHAFPGKKGREYLYSQHFPGLSLLLLPFFILGEKTGLLVFMTRFPISVLTALLGALFFLFAWDLTRNRTTSLLAWFLFCFTAPILFYSQLIYSEVPVSLIFLSISYFVLYKKNISSSTLLLSGIGIALVPWFGIKFIVLDAAVFLMISLSLLKSSQKSPKKVLAFLGPLLVSFGLFLFFLWSLYGKFSPTSVYQWPPPSSFFKWNVFDIGRRLIGYFVDQRTGIFVHSPVLILLIPGIPLLFKRLRKDAVPFLFLSGLWWVFLATSSDFWGGFSPPGRPLLAVQWVLALYVLAALTWSQGKIPLILRRILIFLSVVAALICLQNPRLLYHENLAGIPGEQGLYSNLLASFSNSLIDWTKFVPSLSNRIAVYRHWRPLIFWIPAILVLTFIFLKKHKTRTQKPSFSLAFHLAYVLALCIVFMGYAFWNVHLDRAFIFEDKGYTLLFQDENHFGKELDGFWTKGENKTILFIQVPNRLTEISLGFSSPVPGGVTARVGREKTAVVLKKKTALSTAIKIPSPVGFPWKGGYLYLIQIRADRGFTPSKLDGRSTDGRSLGVFVTIEVHPPGV
jgi:hypothetical protein